MLEDAGIKLASVASRVLGVSGRAILDALVAGTSDPGALAALARGGLRTKLPELRQALVGRFCEHQAFLVAHILAHLDYLDETIETVSAQIGTVIAPFADELARLDTIPGVNQRTAEVLIAELGVDMSVFPTAGHLASWASLRPGNHESAGQHISGRTRKGNRWRRSALIEAALGAGTHSAKGAFAARYRRVMRHRGHRKPSSRSRTPCSSRSTICLPRTPPTTILVPPTMTAALPSGCGAARSTPSNARATASFSNPRPEREDNHYEIF